MRKGRPSSSFFCTNVMTRISLQFKASGSACGKIHTYLFAIRTIGLLSYSFSLIFFILTANFPGSFGTTTDLSPDYEKEVSPSTNDYFVYLPSRVKRPFFHLSKELLDSGHDAVIGKEKRSQVQETALSQAMKVFDSEHSESEALSLLTYRRLQQSSVPQGVQTILVVSNDGLPNHFPTVQAAVDAVPMWNYVNWIIYIKPGIYYGTVLIPEGKNYITFLGEDPAVTTLSCQRNARDTPMGILDCPCVIVEASYFRAENIAFENSSPKPAELDYNSQAPAIRISGDASSFYGCSFLGWQDTLFADQGRHYYESCRVEGSVDFILGYARALFNNCSIHSKSEGFITAQSRWCDSDCIGASSGFVFLNCTLTGVGPTFLGRPWREYAKVVYIDTWMDSHIVPHGWEDWLDGDWPVEHPLFSHDNVYFAERNSQGPGANPQARISWSHQIGEAEVEANSYRDVKAFLDGESWMQKPPSIDDVLNSDLMKSFTSFTTIHADDLKHDSHYPRRREKDLTYQVLD